MDYEKIGALIRRLRTQQGLTQRQLAVQLDISDEAVSKWERGQGCPDVSLLPRLAQTLAMESLFGTACSMGSFTSWCDPFSSVACCGILTQTTIRKGDRSCPIS